jgi:hypothetical protein
MEVPLIVLVGLAFVCQVERMFWPGARRSITSGFSNLVDRIGVVGELTSAPIREFGELIITVSSSNSDCFRS